MRRFALPLLWLAAGMAVHAAELPSLEAPRAEARPVVDGRFDDHCWRDLPWHTGFTRLGGGEPAERQTRFKIFHDGRRLYLAIEADEPEPGSLAATPGIGKDSPLLWNDDSLEINLIPDASLLRFYKIVVNADGVYGDMLAVDDNTDSNQYVMDAEWDAGLQVKTTLGKGAWRMEAAIPFGAMDFMPDTTSAWRFNIGRNRYAGGKAEHSSFSPLGEFNHILPREFAVLHLRDLPLDAYAWEIANTAWTFDKTPEGAFTFTLNADVYNRTGEFRIMRLASDLAGDATKVAGEQVDSLRDGRFKRVAVTLAPDEPGRHLFTLRLYARPDYLLKQFQLPVDLYHRSLDVAVIRPPYRANLYATMPDKTIEAEIRLREHVGAPLRVELRGESEVVKTWEIAEAEAVNAVRFDGQALADGTYRLRATNEAGSTEAVIRKLPRHPGEVWLDAEGITHIDGEKTLPIGWYQANPEYDTPWFNLLVHTGRYRDLETAHKYNQDNLERGRRTMPFPFQEMSGEWDWRIFKDPDMRKGSLTEDQRRQLRVFIEGMHESEGLLGWYIADEPEGRDGNPVWYLQAHNLLTELDPYHPTFMLNWGIQGMRQYYEGCDILFPDCYPQYFIDGSTGKPRWCTSEWIKAGTALGRPVWLCLQITPWPELSRDGKLLGVPPNLDDQRSQFYQALVHDAKGFAMYSFFESQGFDACRFGPDAIARELQLLKDYLLPNTVPGGVRVATDPDRPHFQAGLKTFGDGAAVIAVNTSLDDVRVEFTLDRPVGDTLYVAGENRSVPVKDRVFSDTFGPNISRVYLTDRALAEAVHPQENTRREIDAARAARKKPGNVVATGELMLNDYTRFAAGDVPDGVVRIAASSDKRYYGTMKIGSLYYLVDGITEPNRQEMSWAPQAGDAQPWVEFELPCETVLREVRVYTPCVDGAPNLVAGAIQVGDDRRTVATFADNDGPVVVLPLEPPVATKRVRVAIHEARPVRPGDDKLTSRLLTEVELYGNP